MASYIIDESTLKNLANAIRNINGETKTYTPNEMIQAVTNIMDSVTYLLVDKYGTEYPALYVESKTVFDATPDDIQTGKIAATDSGVTTGTVGNTFILIDEEGNEISAALTDEVVNLTATTNDIRSGSIAITNDGVVTGEKEIPSYYVSEGYRAVPKGSKFILPLNNYDYTKLQAIFCPFNTSITKSVSAEKVAIEGNLYTVQSMTAEATIIKDHSNAWVDFGITNESGGIYLIRYFSYKEIY